MFWAKNEALEHSIQNLPPRPLSEYVLVTHSALSARQKETIPSCLVFNSKSSHEGSHWPPISAEEKFSLIHVPHRNRLCFSLLLSFAEAKESRRTDIGQAKERMGSCIKAKNTEFVDTVGSFLLPRCKSRGKQKKGWVVAQATNSPHSLPSQSLDNVYKKSSPHSKPDRFIKLNSCRITC
jgi:hypothetical protein